MYSFKFSDLQFNHTYNTKSNETSNTKYVSYSITIGQANPINVVIKMYQSLDLNISDFKSHKNFKRHVDT